MTLVELAHRGTLPGGEVFSHSIWVDSGSALAVVATDAAAAFIAELTAEVDAEWNENVSWTSLHASEVVEATGLVVATVDSAMVVPGGLSGNPLPPQCAMVVSLRTSLAGRSHRGRSYLPAPDPDTMTTGGRYGATVCTNMVTAFKAYLDALDGLGHDPVVYSRLNHAVRVIESIDIGDVVDTQRRRRDTLLETRHSAALA
jgi:hypothetical protein